MFIKPIIALDIGPNSVKALQLKRAPRGLHLARIGIRDYPRPLDPRNKAERPFIIEIIKDLSRKTKLTPSPLPLPQGERIKVRGTKKVVLALPRYHCFVEKIELPTEDERKTKQIINLNLSDYIPLPANRIYYSYQILKKGAGKTELLLVACKREIVDDYLQIVREAGLIPSIIEVSSQVILNTLRLNYPQNEVIALLDLRPGMSEVVIVSKGELLFSRGFILSGTDEKSFSEIQRSLEAFRAEHPEARINRILLAGEGAGLPGLKDLIEKELDHKVEMANPLQNIALDHPNIQAVSHRLMKAVGLAIRGMQKKGMNLLPRERAEAKAQKRKILVALPSLIPLILLLAAGLLFIDLKKKDEELRITDQKLTAIGDEVKEARELKRKLALVERLKEKGTTPIDVLKELNQTIPDKIWLTELSLDKERLHIQGQSLKDQDVADLLQALNNSLYFKETTLISSVLTKLEDTETIDFQIACFLR